MIYTVTLNPSLDYIVSVDDFRLGMTNRTSTETILPGGKGINVSMVLKNLGVESTALGFTAGFTGREICRKVEQTGVKAEFIQLSEGISRINLKLKSIDGTEINGAGPKVSRKDLESLMKRLDGLAKGDTLVLAGSIPASIPDSVYKDILEGLRDREVTVVVDATGDLLRSVLEYRPFLIKPNNHELGDLFDVKLKYREEVIPYAKKLQTMGAMNVLVSMGEEGAVLAAADGRIYESPPPQGILVNSVGAGDSMVAGFLVSWMEQKDYGHAFYLGVSAGSASAYSETLAARDQVEALYRKLRGQ